MTVISVDKEFLEELVDLKLKFLNDESEKILTKWNYQMPSQFLKDAADGTIEEAEDDAITLKHLIDQCEELLKLKASWNNI
jgi:replication initiation and membrane attachment protein DnaB